MSRLLRTLVILLIIIALGFWFFTVLRSCNEARNKPLIEDRVTDSEADKNTLSTDKLEDLFEEEDDLEEGDGEGDGNVAGDEDEDEGEEEDDRANATTRSDEGRSDSRPITTSSAALDRYIVVAGAFITEDNALANVRQLKKKGFSDAEVVTFDRSEYHSVCVGRFGSLSEARSLKNQLARSGVEAYVHKRRGKQVN